MASANAAVRERPLMAPTGALGAGGRIGHQIPKATVGRNGLTEV